MSKSVRRPTCSLRVASVWATPEYSEQLRTAAVAGDTAMQREERVIYDRMKDNDAGARVIALSAKEGG